MSDKKKVLIIEDEAPIRRFLKAGLPDENFELIEATTGKEGIRAVATYNPDIVLLDLGLPDIDGLTVTKELRSWSKIPIIVLSARGQEQDKIDALDSGADDYLTKPFGIGELLARMRVSLRNAERSLSPSNESVFELADLKVDFSSRVVKVNNQVIHLTPIEFKLLTVLINHAGRVLTHRQILTEVWGAAYARETQYLRVFMGQLRHKIEKDPARPALLTTESGVGYRLKTPS